MMIMIAVREQPQHSSAMKLRSLLRSLCLSVVILGQNNKKTYYFFDTCQKIPTFAPN